MNKGVFKAILAVILIGMIVSMSSCRTVSKIEYIDRLDTVYIAKTDIEKEFVHDSVYIKEKSDTIWIEKWHVRDREVVKCDTVVQVVENEVIKTETVEKIVKQTPWYCGVLIWILLIISVLLAFYVIYLKIFR